jgi:prevent-host-death family protein
MTTTVTATKARANLYKIIDDAGKSHRPVVIRSNAVLISEDDWNSIQETLYLTAIPGMRESIVKGMKTTVADCDKSAQW